MENSRYELFDTHVHLDRFGAPGSEARAARCLGVRDFVLPGVERRGWRALLAAAEQVEGALAAPGLHPLDAASWDEDCAAELRFLLDGGPVVAVGEIGLDALLPFPSREAQEGAFRGQLQLAVEFGLPVLIHCRKAAGRTLAILREEGAQRVGGIFHGFSGSLETAREAVALGFAIGVGAPVTYPGARRLPQVVRELPGEALVLETDAPDQAPHPHRGQPGRPAYLPLVAQQVATLRGWSLEEAAAVTTANACRVLKLEGSPGRFQKPH